MKKIITFLGIGNYSETTYGYNNVKITTRYVQEAIAKFNSDSELIVLLTDESIKSNWEGKSDIFKFENKTERNKQITIREKIGEVDNLKNILDKNNINYRTIIISDGNNDEEIWENFNLIVDELNQNDDIYVDITHSFRSIPIIMMSVINYAKFIKNINVKGIYYGAFDAKYGNVSPIVDLSLFDTFNDWAIASENFLSSGNSKKLVNLIESQIKPILKECKGKNEEARHMNGLMVNLEKFSRALYTVRGNEINEITDRLKYYLENIQENNIKALLPFCKILDDIYIKIKLYKKDDLVWNIFHTAKLCNEFEMIQQSATFLAENVINHIFIKAKLPIYNENSRMAAGKVIASKHRESEFKLSSEYDEIKSQIDKYISDDIVNFYLNIGQLRNDLNHGGFRHNKIPYKDIKIDLEKKISDFERIIIFSKG